MKIAVLAAKGRAGSAIVQEAINAGFEVSAFVRSKAHFDERVHLVVKDMFSLTSTDLQGFDVIIDAFGEWQDLSLHLKHIEYLNSILQGNEAKLIVVGGAGSLYMNTTHTLRLMDTPEFPKNIWEWQKQLQRCLSLCVKAISIGSISALQHFFMKVNRKIMS
jgi:hypothetical protein